MNRIKITIFSNPDSSLGSLFLVSLRFCFSNLMTTV